MPVDVAKRMSRTDRHRSLLDAASRVLLRRDAALSFETIATEAQVSPTLPYKYFESVDDVAHQLYRRIVDAVDARTAALLADSDRSFDDQVRESAELWCETVVRDGPLLLRLADGGAHPSLARAIDERRERDVAAWAELIEARFDVAPDIARIVAASITAGSAAALNRWIRDGLERSEVVDMIVALASAQVEAAASLAAD